LPYFLVLAKMQQTGDKVVMKVHQAVLIAKNSLPQLRV
jgi:hypothetical protein